MDLRQVFAQDAQRSERLSMQSHVFADLSKNRWNGETGDAVAERVEECQLAGKRDAMLAGDAINTSEQRSVMHWLLRTPRDGGSLAASAAVQAWPAEMQTALQDVHATLDQMCWRPPIRFAANPQITDIVNIGIGGSHLGPRSL